MNDSTVSPPPYFWFLFYCVVATKYTLKVAYSNDYQTIIELVAFSLKKSQKKKKERKANSNQSQYKSLTTKEL